LCSFIESTKAARHCIESTVHDGPIPEPNLAHSYTLSELIDIAESASPQGRIAWAAAKHSLEVAGINQALYLPIINLAVRGSDARSIVPFPKPIAPRGYVTVEEPIAEGRVEMQYVLLDFARGAKIDASKALELATTLRLGRMHQTIANDTSVAFYKAQEAASHLDAARTILATAQTLLDNSQMQFNNGRATLPDLLNAQAGVAEAGFDVATAQGEVKKSKLALTEIVGFEPTINLDLESATYAPPEDIEDTVEEVIHTAWKSRPDLLARADEVRNSASELRQARAAYLPTIDLRASGGPTATWPTADFGQLGYANVSTWSAAASLNWEIFNGARRHAVQAASADHIAAVEKLRATKDAVTRQVWDTYVDYQTSVNQVHSSQSFLAAAQTSYDSSLDAYRYGVRSLVDVVQAERQLAQARFAVVRSQSQLMQSAVALDYAASSLVHHDTSSSGVHP
jgi:outer membrane protein